MRTWFYWFAAILATACGGTNADQGTKSSSVLLETEKSTSNSRYSSIPAQLPNTTCQENNSCLSIEQSPLASETKSICQELEKVYDRIELPTRRVADLTLECNASRVDRSTSKRAI